MLQIIFIYSTVYKNNWKCRPPNFRVKTEHGKLSYKQLYKQLYKKCGYSLCLNQTCQIPEIHSNVSLPPLIRHKRSCSDVISEWLDSNSGADQPKEPPRRVPASLAPEFTLGGLIPVKFWYSNEAHNSEDTMPLNWTIDEVQRKLDMVEANNWMRLAYGGEAENLDTALKNFPLHGNGLIIGSLDPWVEAICLHHGAGHITTAEYHPINSTHPQISTIHPLTMAKNYKKYLGMFDFAASFSSIEHSGLGRYGDHVDPNGDLLEMEKVRCFLKENGLFYLSVPIGSDYLTWNVHRIYGNIRYPMMAAGFEIMGAFRRQSVSKLDLIEGYDYNRQDTIVLRKRKAWECF